MRYKKKAQLMVWLSVLIVLFVVGASYLMLSPVFSKIKDATTPLINDTYQPTIDKIDNAWGNWPIISLLVLFVAGFIIAANLQQSGAL